MAELSGRQASCLGTWISIQEWLYPLKWFNNCLLLIVFELFVLVLVLFEIYQALIVVRS